MPGPLQLDVFVVAYQPIVGLIPPMGEGDATWPATSVSLISGERNAVLIDARHGHGDHFFGLNTILDAFPDAGAVTAAAEAHGQLSPDLMQFWNAIFPGRIAERPIVPEPLDGDVIDLEGHELRIITVGQSDTAPSTIVHVPELEAVFAGDVAYNGIHQCPRPC